MECVLDNDDGWILSSHAGEPPLTPEMMWDQMVGPRAGTPIDTFLWSVAGNETYSYRPSKLLEVLNVKVHMF